MSESDPEIDKVSLRLHEQATEYAQSAAGLASDPYFREAIVKASVSSFVWALYHAFSDDTDRDALALELKFQSTAIDRAVRSASEASL